MAFEATKREWGELYAFFRILADGKVYAAWQTVKSMPELLKRSAMRRMLYRWQWYSVRSTTARASIL